MAQLIFKKRIIPDAGKVMTHLVSVQEVENKFYDPKKQSEDKAKQLEWVFGYETKPEMQIRLWSTKNLSVYKGKKSRALTITEALLGKELTDEEKENYADTDQLIGKKCYLTVKHEKNDDGQIYAKVVDFENESGIPF